MAPDQRLDRAERVLILMIKAGDRARREWREKHDQLVAMQIRHGEEWRAESRAMDEKINILIHTQMETSEQMKGLAASRAELQAALKALAASQVKTERALRVFLSRRR